MRNNFCRCPVTGLTVRIDTTWRQVLGPAHRKNFALIGQSILYCASEQSVTLAKMKEGKDHYELPPLQNCSTKRS